MKAVIQIVNNATLTVDNKLISEIGYGYVIYLGVKKGDTKEIADYFIKKITNLRIFEDEFGKTNLSIKDVNGEILLVSQFTLLANTSHGNRPDFLEAEVPDKANELYEYVKSGLELNNIVVKKGVFGADMTITQQNKGPFTVVMEK